MLERKWQYLTLHRLTDFLKSIEIKSNVKRENKSFEHLTTIPFFKKLIVLLTIKMKKVYIYFAYLSK